MKSIVASFLFLLLIVGACRYPRPAPVNYTNIYIQIDSVKKMLRNGDIIFRNGNDEVSQAARSFNRIDTSYSHCGLVLIENDTPYVYHALGGSYNPSQKLMRQIVDSFSNPLHNVAVGVYRYKLDTVQLQTLRTIIHQYYQQGLRFDLFFNLETDDEMYCAEFVFKSLNQAMHNSLTPYLKKDSVPFGITLDDLFLHPNCQLVKRVSYK